MRVEGYLVMVPQRIGAGWELPLSVLLVQHAHNVLPPHLYRYTHPQRLHGFIGPEHGDLWRYDGSLVPPVYAPLKPAVQHVLSLVDIMQAVLVVMLSCMRCLYVLPLPPPPSPCSPHLQV